jgi:hypothetical protein
LVLVHEHHAGPAFDIVETVGYPGDFLSKRLVECQQMMDLRIERRLSLGLLVARWYRWK